MGHHFSKPTVRVASQDKNNSSNTQQKSLEEVEDEAISLAEEQPQQVQLVEEIVAQTDAASSEVRQIIIKIQLAKMENGNGGQVLHDEEEVQGIAVAAAALSADTLNANEQQIVVEARALASSGGGLGLGVGVGVGSVAVSNRTAGSSTEAPKTERQQLVNNNNLAGSGVGVGNIVAEAAISTLQLNDVHDADADTNAAAADDDDDDNDDDDDDVDESLLRRRHQHSHEAEVVEYCEVLESLPVSEMLSTGAQHICPSVSNSNRNSKQAPRGSAASGNSCCRSRRSKALSMGATESTAAAAAAAAAAAPTSSKRRCCKCKCRDALRGFRDMLDSSKDKKESSTSSSSSAVTSRKSRTADRRSTPPTLSGASGSGLGIPQQRLQTQRKRNSVAVPEPSQLAIWTAPANGDVIIRISSPQFVVESPNARVTVGPNIRLVTEPAPAPLLPHLQHQHLQQQLDPQQGPPVRLTYGRRSVTVHSQIDFMHCLVPDLERIINSSFYWGKMDRYEAEHLLEGKPEGTFLLRDSAQEEFLFSVTFRKYGRSLHARIEQSGHKFSFDCHDPCVFTAPTVTGLLEHYKDPSCVMFFEPCLTMPLHRRQTFSLQQLARATIVSSTSYDGINQLELPGRLKSYLKEYHYKQKLRVKPCDAHTPAPFYGNV
ncbi:uncharacterized protein LOC108163130 [Drosophila miranda]|uniref:uncharacterized protein LOC108163130 n=1 Tax=Drosophila miranda TaxID=7229 RepID=UPI0007E7CB7A|nr:uncharacterized protein LOC108163130 [Drosophila miranda]